MNTIIEKLKAIIRLQIKRENLNFAALGGGGQTWNIETLEWVLKRISDLEKEEKPTIQEQPVKIDIRKELASIEFMGVNDARDSETIARHFYELGCRRTAEKYDEIEYKRQRADVCEGLEEEIKRYYSDNFAYLSSDQPTLSILTNIARHFAQWGAEHRGRSETPKDQDIAEASEKYAGELYGYELKSDEDLQKVIACICGFKAGAKWQKEQMMSEAVEGEVVKDISNKLAVTAKINLDGFKFGQKVRIIVVKED